MQEKLTSQELEETVIDFLKEHKQASLATVSDDIPRSSPVQYFLGDSKDIFILSAGGTKFKNIESNPNVCLLVNSEYIDHRKIKGVQIFGKATTSIKNPAIYSEAKKYFSDAHLLDAENNGLKVIKIMPKEIVYLNSLEDGNRVKQVLTDDEVYTKMDD